MDVLPSNAILVLANKRACSAPSICTAVSVEVESLQRPPWHSCEAAWQRLRNTRKAGGFRVLKNCPEVQRQRGHLLGDYGMHYLAKSCNRSLRAFDAPFPSIAPRYTMNQRALPREDSIWLEIPLKR
jgi:hypothetical protein